MLQKLKYMLITLIGTGVLIVPMAFVPATAMAATVNTQNGACAGTNFDLTGSNTTNCSSGSTAAASGIGNLLTTVVNVFSIIVGAVAVIMIIVGGFKYITSGGDSGNVSGAKNTIIYALIGLLIVALAQVIVHFVLAKFTGVQGG